MAEYQILTGYVALSGDRGNTVFRGPDSPMTYPESLVLAALHGGAEYVHTLVEIGREDRDPVAEYERLELKYGRIVRDLFPPLAGRTNLPLADDKLPTEDEVAAAQAAAKEAAAKVRQARSKGAGKGRKPKNVKADETPDVDAEADTDADTEADAVPSLEDLPS